MTVDFMTAPLRDIRMLRLAQVKVLVGLSESRIRQLGREGKFPKRISIGDNSTGYIEGDIRRWLDDRAKHGKLQPKGATAPLVAPVQKTTRKPTRKGAK